jgi:hypothetical protein
MHGMLDVDAWNVLVFSTFFSFKKWDPSNLQKTYLTNFLIKLHDSSLLRCTQKRVTIYFWPSKSNVSIKMSDPLGH